MAGTVDCASLIQEMDFTTRCRGIGSNFLVGTSLLGLGVFIVFALNHTVSGNIVVLVIIGISLLWITYRIGTVALSEQRKEKWRHLWIRTWQSRKTKIALCVGSGAVALGVSAYVVVDASLRRPRRLASLAGLATLVLGCALLSESPGQIRWRVVAAGVTSQLLLGLLVVRWPPAQVALMWVGNQITTFIDYAKEGALFVFGTEYLKHPFAMEVMSMLVYFSAVVSLLGHQGVLEIPFRLVGEVIQFVLGTSPTESFVAAANIFLGPNDSILLVLPMMAGLSISELHAVMASGMATIGGGTLAAFVKFGVPASHLVSASLMSAPAVLVTSKLLLPETSDQPRPENTLCFSNKRYHNALEAFSAGAAGAVPMVGAILVTLIAFLAGLDLVNTTLTWVGLRVGLQNLTIQLLCGYLLTPVAFLMGVSWADSPQVAALIGLKTIVNEFVAYTELSQLISNRKQGLLPSISERSEAIAVYALCGYSNVGTMASLLGFMTVLAPTRQGELSRVAVRSLCSAIIACLMTGCVAGLLIED